MILRNIFNFVPKTSSNFKTNLSFMSTYQQGQSPEPKIREYFYYIDHQGMLFLDDARMKNFTSCFKETKFLKFFFNQLRLNNTDRYRKEFPYLSLCGKERNYIRCDDFPIVFTNVIVKAGEKHVAYNHAGDVLSMQFQPEKIFMLPATGRVYHPAPERAGSVGLVQSKLAIEFSKYFTFENGESEPPTKFSWQEETYKLDNEWYHEMIKKKLQ